MKDDEKENKRTQVKIEDNIEVEIFQKDIKKGDIIKIYKNQQIPADLILLESSS